MKNLDLSSQRHECKMQNSECSENSVPLAYSAVVKPLATKAGCLCASVPSSSSAFTLLEVMIATALFGLVVAGTIEVYIMCNKLWHVTSLSMQTSRESSLALSRVIYGMETNNGLRSAAMVMLNTNVHGHLINSTNKYWETGATPPAAGNADYYACQLVGMYSPDGSWRLIISNASDGVKYLDYNIQARNILFCPDTNQTVAARQKRILVCNYVSAAKVTTNASGMVGLQLTVGKRDGMFFSSNTVSTSVKMRNKP